MSGMSNVRYWLAQRKLPASDEVCQRILAKAKSVSWTLTEDEVMAIVSPPAPKKAVKTKAKAPKRKAPKVPRRRAKR